MKNYRSSIPKAARERVVATSLRGPRKYKTAFFLDGEIVGVRFFDEAEGLELESPLKKGLLHGTRYYFDEGKVIFSAPFVNGLAHGIARQWSREGKPIGTYLMKHGTGLDLWRVKGNWGTGKPYLSEARYWRDGMLHGFEWWLNEDQRTIHHEIHFWKDQYHGIERMWNTEGRLKRGYPKYWVNNEQVAKRRYDRMCEEDGTLPRFRKADNRPTRKFPPEVVVEKR